MADPVWDNGEYLKKTPNLNGLAVARMVGHISYLSEKVCRRNLEENFRKKLTMNLVLMQIFKLKVVKTSGPCIC